MANKLKDPRSANGVDMRVGERIRAARNIKDMSQEQLAGHLGISFQQVQKYEKGVNRVTIGRLIELSNALEVPISWLIESAEGYDPKKKNDTGDLAGTFFRLPYAIDVAKDFIALKHNADRDVVRTVTRALTGR